MDGDNAQAHNMLGLIHLERGDDASAEKYFIKAVEIDPRAVEPHCNLGFLATRRLRFDAAMAHYRNALALAPDHLDALAGEAALLERQGDVEQAYARVRAWVDQGTTHPHLLVTFAQISPKVRRERDAVQLMERALLRPGLNLNQRIDLHFGLGKLYDRLGEYDAAFDHYRRGNEIRPGEFDAARFALIVDQIIEAYSEAFLARAPHASNDSPAPVFIVGMSRSGTSLVEQILASHPSVHGAGELLHIREISASLMARIGMGLSVPQAMERVTSAILDELAQPHLDRLHQMSSGALRVTDKMPSNHLSLGLIALLFPGARIIHTKRHPLDSCLSCYFQNFTGGHDYTLKLSDLGAYYVQYQRLMAHWRKVLRLPLLEIQYEDMVTDMERHARTLVEFCGLPWDHRCLRFYENKRTVKTASYDQVREPIYSRSTGRWRHYEKHLGPLIEALGVFAGPPD
jgi:tetratricopeptide (TPR) repeat protein